MCYQLPGTNFYFIFYLTLPFCVCLTLLNLRKEILIKLSDPKMDEDLVTELVSSAF